MPSLFDVLKCCSTAFIGLAAKHVDTNSTVQDEILVSHGVSPSIPAAPTQRPHRLLSPPHPPPPPPPDSSPGDGKGVSHDGPLLEEVLAGDLFQGHDFAHVMQQAHLARRSQQGRTNPPT